MDTPKFTNNGGAMQFMLLLILMLSMYFQLRNVSDYTIKHMSLIEKLQADMELYYQAKTDLDIETRELVKETIEQLADRYNTLRRNKFSILDWFREVGLGAPCSKESRGSQLKKEQFRDMVSRALKEVKEKRGKLSPEKQSDRGRLKIVSSAKTFTADFELCEKLTKDAYKPTDDEKIRMKNKTFLINRKDWWDLPKNKFREKFDSVWDGFDKQNRVPLATFEAIVKPPSKIT